MVEGGAKQVHPDLGSWEATKNQGVDKQTARLVVTKPEKLEPFLLCAQMRLTLPTMSYSVN